MSTPSPIIRLEGIKKVFLTDEIETHALSGIHLEIAQGEYVSIAGPSGCGKSTLLAILGLLDTPSEGTYLLNQQQVANLDHAQRVQEIQALFQEPDTADGVQDTSLRAALETLARNVLSRTKA